MDFYDNPSLFGAEPIVAFAFDELGARVVEDILTDVYDGESNGYVPTVYLAEFRSVTVRRASVESANAHITDLEDLGVSQYGVDDLWESASALNARYSPSRADAYAVAAKAEADLGHDVPLLVGGDDDYDVFEETEGFSHLIERSRDGHA